MLDESSDGVGDVMLDEDEPQNFNAYGELDAAYHMDLFQEHSLDGNADEEVDLLDDDLFWEHSEDEVVYDGMESLDDVIPSSVPNDSHAKFCGALAFESGDDAGC